MNGYCYGYGYGYGYGHGNGLAPPSGGVGAGSIELFGREKKIRIKDAVKFIVNVLLKHEKDKDIYEWGIKCLKIIFERDTEEDITGDSHVIETVLQCANEHVNDLALSTQTWNLIPDIYKHQGE